MINSTFYKKTFCHGKPRSIFNFGVGYITVKESKIYKILLKSVKKYIKCAYADDNIIHNDLRYTPPQYIFILLAHHDIY